AGGDGGGGAAARAARRAARVPRVARRAVGVGLGRRQDAELGRVRLADGDEAGLAEALGQVGVDGRAEPGVLEEAAPEMERLAREGGAEVLEQERHAPE